MSSVSFFASARAGALEPNTGATNEGTATANPLENHGVWSNPDGTPMADGRAVSLQGRSPDASGGGNDFFEGLPTLSALARDFGLEDAVADGLWTALQVNPTRDLRNSAACPSQLVDPLVE